MASRDPQTTSTWSSICGQGDIDAFIAAIGSDFYVARDAVVEAVGTGGAFNVIHMPAAVKVDIFIAGLDGPYLREWAVKLDVSDLLERALGAPGRWECIATFALPAMGILK